MPRTASSAVASKVVGAKIKQARRDAGLTQVEVATRLRTKAPYVSSVENGHANVTVGQLAAIADAIGAELRLDLVVVDLGPEPAMSEE